MNENEKRVLEFLKNSDKPLRPGDIAQGLNMDSKDVSEIIAKLKKEDKIYSPKRCYYTAKK